MPDLPLTLTRLITPQTRPAALKELEATIGSEAAGRLGKALEASPYTARHNGLSTSRCKAWLERYIANHDFSPTSIRVTLDYIRRYQKLGPIRGRVLDYGCGQMNPLGLGVLLYLNGADSVVSVDPGAFEFELSVASLKELSNAILAEPERFDLFGVGRAEILRRFSMLDWAALYKLQDNPQVRPVQGTSADVEGTFDTVLSTSVMEHIEDVRGELQRLHRMTNPGAMMLHRIDLTDHRHHMPGYHRFGFMRDGQYKGLNGLRCCEFLQLFEEAGFKVVTAEKARVELDDAFMKSVVPPFDRFDRDELSITVVNTAVVRGA